MVGKRLSMCQVSDADDYVLLASSIQREVRQMPASPVFAIRMDSSQDISLCISKSSLAECLAVGWPSQ
jgi:hypothetical protein